MLSYGKVLGALCFLMCCIPYNIVNAGNSYEINATEKEVVVSSGESLIVDGDYRLFKYTAVHSGVVQVTADCVCSESCSVLVYKDDLGEVVTQSSVLKESKDLGVIFHCEKDQVYFFYWDGLEENEVVNWSLVEKPVKGISSLNPIQIKAGSFDTDHSHKGDYWYVFQADTEGSYLISSLGLTNENTCLSGILILHNYLSQL